jgi:endonuclease-3
VIRCLIVDGDGQTEKLRRVVAILDDAYGRPVLQARYAPLDELVFTILSQNTADVNTERSFAQLKERFPTWQLVRDAEVEEIEAAIKLGGLAHTKAPRIKRVLEALSADDVPDLSLLDTMSDGAALRFLTSLPGVGPKTAACVLLFSLGRPVMPVDTHVYRVARRLGLIPATLSVEQAHGVLTEMAGPDAAQIYAAHVDLVRHGRRICHARRSRCGACLLAPICPSAGLV